ncbi:NAD-dependent epimerase/dehydratase family protein [Picosynechococcus sp. PCC 11901]|uniref:NAD-dependent epimerase/dehydratase family protein n=1 Tax=Picosynechococcus sp. PCC 11901 TaxID=2579791 RepID=UPI0010FC3949|nr:NAD-dependent epimerase/dehydratase family protein [Picosynechococcus sp. PCC 11901]QCS50297.1 NAD-dependent epimerase/dehydratase family protein [Picosynechococcus sp. PCC 11901]
MRILIIGGTRFIGVYLTQVLLAAGHEVVLFNRGNHPAPTGVGQIIGDRQDPAQLKEKLAGETFDAIFDNNGRELAHTQPLAEIFAGKVKHFIYVSSAGVYLPTEQPPHKEADPVDPNSRHKGKHETEAYLAQSDLPWTSIRPTYIYGAKNYNDLEAWFFDRIVRDRPIPIPGDGQLITQFGHVYDLATAMAAVLDNPKAIGQIYNISGDRFVTFTGLAKACAVAAGKDPAAVDLVYYDPKKFDLGKRKAFPIRAQHFMADIHKALNDLDWQPKYDLVGGLKDSFQNDYLANERDKAAIDFSLDDQILSQQ